jgi:WD40 repeat protein
MILLSRASWRKVSEQMAMRCRFSRDGKTLATQGQGLIKIWDGQSGDYRFLIRGAHWDLAFTPDGKQVASVDESRAVRFWDAMHAQGSVVHTAKESLYHARFGGDGRRVIHDEGTILDAATGAVLRTIPTPEGEQAGATILLPDGKHVIQSRSKAGPSSTRVTKGDLILWDLEAAREVKRLAAIALPICLAISRDGRWFLALNSREGDDTYKQHELVVRDASTLEPVLTRKDPLVYGRYAVFTSDSKSILVGKKDSVALIDVPSGREQATYGPLPSEPLAMAVSADGRWIAAAPSVQRPIESSVHVWDSASGSEVHVIPQTASEDVTTLSFSPDGRRLASAGFDAKIKIWDTESGLEVLTLAGHTSWIWEVWFSPDGQRILSCSRDHAVRIWDASPIGP